MSLGSVIAILAVAFTLLVPVPGRASTTVPTVAGGLNGWVEYGSNGATISGTVDQAAGTGDFSVSSPPCPTGATCGSVYPTVRCTDALGLTDSGTVVPYTLGAGGGAFTGKCNPGDTVSGGASGYAVFDSPAGSTALGVPLPAPYEYSGHWTVNTGGDVARTGQLSVAVGDNGVFHAVYTATGAACVDAACYLEAESDWSFPANVTLTRIGPLSGTDISVNFDVPAGTIGELRVGLIVPSTWASFTSLSAPVFLSTEAATVPVDPVPPPPNGDIITPHGYDLTQIAQSMGAPAAACLTLNTIPQPPSESSIKPLTQSCLQAELRNLTTLQILGVLVGIFGEGFLLYLEYVVVTPGDNHPAQTQPNPGQAPKPVQQPGTQGQGGAGGPAKASGPDDATVNEIVRAWRLRIYDGDLGNNSVATDTSPYTDSMLTKAARTCLILAATAATAGTVFDAVNPCRTMRVLFPAGASDGSGLYNAFAAAQHDYDAITTINSRWVQLNYMSGGNKQGQVDREWYNRAPYSAAGKCKDRPAGVPCDEYPLYATTQGGPAKDNGLETASLRPIDAGQNRVEGSLYSAMVSTNRCAMQSAAPVQAGQVATGGTPFLVVPLPDIAVPSFFLC
jgi:hypothetical protein